MDGDSTRKIVWVSGCSGAGKSFTGDYLESQCGFIHIDGDEDMRSKEPEHVEISTPFVKCFHEYWFDEKKAPDSMWLPYIQAIVDKVAQVDEAKDVVVTLSVYNRQVRDAIHRLLPAVVYFQLELENDVLLERHKKRFAKYAEAQGKSIADTWQDLHAEEYTQENYAAKTFAILKGLQPLQDDEKNSHTINVADNDLRQFEQMHQILDLPNVPTSLEQIPFEEIAEMNYKRF